MSNLVFLEPNCVAEIEQIRCNLVHDAVKYANLSIGTNATMKQITNFLAHKFPVMSSAQWMDEIVEFSLRTGGEVLG